MASSAAPKASVLNSWKEIASYLGRGVRTVQRWEHDLGMPVRRPRAKSRSAVVALPEEIDAWLRAAPANELAKTANTPAVRGNGALKPSIDAAHELRSRCDNLRRENQLVLKRLLENLKVMESTVKQSGEYQRAIRHAWRSNRQE